MEIICLQTNLNTSQKKEYVTAWKRETSNSSGWKVTSSKTKTCGAGPIQVQI